MPPKYRWRCKPDHVPDEQLVEIVNIEDIDREQFEHLLCTEPVVPRISRELDCANRSALDIMSLCPYPLLKPGVGRDIPVLKRDVVDKNIIDEHALRSHRVQRYPVRTIYQTLLDHQILHRINHLRDASGGKLIIHPLCKVVKRHRIRKRPVFIKQLAVVQFKPEQGRLRDYTYLWFIHVQTPLHCLQLISIIQCYIV